MAREVYEHDLILLGLGDDGHAVSLFPGTQALSETQRHVVVNYVPKLNSWRLTFTFPLIFAARAICFLIGANKDPKLIEQIFSGDPRCCGHAGGSKREKRNLDYRTEIVIRSF